MGLAFLSTALTLILGLSSLGFILKQKMKLSSHCHHSVLRLQKDLSLPLEKLLKLNPQVKILNHQMKLARKRLIAALSIGHPAAIAAARAHVLIIQNRQIALKAKQRLLLLQAQTHREQFKLSFYPRTQRTTRFPQESQDLAVIERPYGTFLPEYHPTDDFFERQGQSYFIQKTYSFPLIGFGETGFRLSEKCSSSLKPKGGSGWNPVLKKVKAYWRWSYGSSFSAA